MNNVRKIILTRGIQGSGKSFFARNWVLEDPEHRVRFNNDDIRNMLGKYWVPSRENIIVDLKRTFLYSAMKYGYDIVIDNMNLNPKEVDFFKEVIKEHNSWIGHPECLKTLQEYILEFKDFKTPLEVCIERDKKRENPIGVGVIIATYKRYRNFYEEEEESDNC